MINLKIQPLHLIFLNFLNMKVKPILFRLLVLAVLSQAVSCSDPQKKDTENETVSEIPSEFDKKINLDGIKSIQLSEKTKQVTEDWIMYIALNSEVESLNDYTLLDVINNSATIDNVVDSLSLTVPKIFETNAINARIITLKTHARLLQENSKRNEPNPLEIEELIAKLKLDFKNLNIQLNEVFILEENTLGPDTNSTE